MCFCPFALPFFSLIQTCLNSVNNIIFPAACIWTVTRLLFLLIYLDYSICQLYVIFSDSPLLPMRQIAELLYLLPSLSSHVHFSVTRIFPRCSRLMTLTFSSVIYICACVSYFLALSCVYVRPRQFLSSGTSDNSHMVAADPPEVSSRRAVGQWSWSVCRVTAVCPWSLDSEDNLDG